MKIQITKEEKKVLLECVVSGVIDTFKIPRIVNEIGDNSNISVLDLPKLTIADLFDLYHEQGGTAEEFQREVEKFFKEEYLQE